MSVENQAEPIDPLSESQGKLSDFWPKVTGDIRNLTSTDVRVQDLPLARIKRIMKLDDEVKMISAEAPALFSKAAEIFITELTLRAWVHTEDNKRRTLQKNDIAMAITKYDQFDFLIDIVPREEVKATKAREDGTRVSVSADQHYFHIAQHYQTVLQQSAGSTSGQINAQVSSPSTANAQTIQIVQATPQVQAQAAAVTAQVAASTPGAQAEQQQATQIIQVQSPPTQAQSPAGGIQIIQQIVGPDGQIQQIPIQLTPQQLQMIRLQMSGVTQQPIIIQTGPIQAVSQQATQTTGTAQSQMIQLQQV